MKLSLRQIIRWLRANLRAMGCDLETLDITSGTDTVLCALRSGMGRACPLKDFYAGLYPKEEKKSEQRYKPRERTAGLAIEDRGRKRVIGNIQTAEQFGMLAKMGLAVDKRRKK